MVKQFLTLSYDILKLPDLTPTEKLLLGRIAGFDEYFEASAKCAELLGIKEDTVSRAKRHLVELGYISETDNTGRGKKYVANPLWKVAGKTETKKKQEQRQDAKADVPTPKDLGLQASASEARPEKNLKFEQRYADYMPAYDAGLSYLRRQHIGVSDKKALQTDFGSLVDTFSEYSPGEVNKMFLDYIDYLESGPYNYQVQMNKYCPRVLTQNDLYRKFTAIRNFKNSADRHYDPSKVLTT